MGISYHLTWLLGNQYAGQKSNNYNWTWSNRLVQNWERSTSRLYTEHCLFNFYAEYLMQNAGLDESQAGIKIAGRNIKFSQICRWYHPNGRKQRGTKETPDEGERGEWKSWLKTQHVERGGSASGKEEAGMGTRVIGDGWDAWVSQERRWRVQSRCLWLDLHLKCGLHRRTVYWDSKSGRLTSGPGDTFMWKTSSPSSSSSARTGTLCAMENVSSPEPLEWEQ